MPPIPPKRRKLPDDRHRPTPPKHRRDVAVIASHLTPAEDHLLFKAQCDSTTNIIRAIEDFNQSSLKKLRSGTRMRDKASELTNGLDQAVAGLSDSEMECELMQMASKVAYNKALDSAKVTVDTYITTVLRSILNGDMITLRDTEYMNKEYKKCIVILSTAVQKVHRSMAEMEKKDNVTVQQSNKTQEGPHRRAMAQQSAHEDALRVEEELQPAGQIAVLRKQIADKENELELLRAQLRDQTYYLEKKRSRKRLSTFLQTGKLCL